MRKNQRFIRIVLFFLISIISTTNAFATATVKEFVQNYINGLSQTSANNQLKITAKYNESAGPDLWDRLEINYSKNKFLVQYQYNKQLINDPTAVVSEMSILRSLSILSSGKVNEKIFPIMENLYNAKHNSPGAKYLILKSGAKLIDIRNVLTNYAEELSPKKLTLQEITEITNIIQSEVEKKAEVYFKKYKESNAANEKKWEQWKKTTGTLDQLDNAETKLDDLLRNNDRKGVRQLIESYMPWPLMEPYETAAWRSWLDGLEVKATQENSEILFRGVDFESDRTFTNAKGDTGYMSTVLTRNQGNYNRRLRSITTRRAENGVFDVYSASYNSHAVVTVSNQLVSHAFNPSGSSFLSLTGKVGVAASFVGISYHKNKSAGGLIAVKIPKQRMIFNGLSHLQRELEILVPFIIFPDEVVYNKDSGSGIYATNADVLTNEIRKSLSSSDKIVFDRTVKKYAAVNDVTSLYYDNFIKATHDYSLEICQGVFK